VKTTSRKRRRCLLAFARHNLGLQEVNLRLEKSCLDPINGLDWELWLKFYASFVDNNPSFERELVENNRPLSWFVKEINQRKNRNIIS